MATTAPASLAHAAKRGLDGASPAGRPGLPEVLVIDGDRHSVRHCGEMLSELGYSHHGAASPREALEVFSARPAVQILLANVQLPTLDGFALVEEARVRAGAGRAIAAVLIAQDPTTEMAIRGLHVGAVDLLTKPLSFDAYSTALRRAMRDLAARRPGHDGASISDVGDRLDRLVAALEVRHGAETPAAATGEADIALILRRIIAGRALRGRHFSTDLFADPAWEILLDLTRAEMEGQEVSVSSVCIAASVPMSTALRWVRQMTDAGLLRRWTDPRDRRRDLIALTAATSVNMQDYLKAVHAIHKRA